MKVYEITSYLEKFAPSGLQESYDNTGLIIGSAGSEIKKALITLDVTDKVVSEAIENGCDFIIAHHPVIFKSLKKIDYQTEQGALIARIIKEGIAVYAAHTNLDNVPEGVNGILAEKIGLKNTRILSPKKDNLYKLVVFCPVDVAEKVRKAVFNAGAGEIGNYSWCSFNSEGVGTFKASDKANPYVGEIGKVHEEKEMKIETVVPSYFLKGVISAMITAHPYEEVAYDLFPMANVQNNAGTGIIGELEKETSAKEFLTHVKKVLKASAIRHTRFLQKPVKTVAVCGGSCSFLIDHAYHSGADVFITSDVKYHEFFDHSEEMIIVDAGHYETEQFAKELLYDKLIRKFPNFALQISKAKTNPINFL